MEEKFTIDVLQFPTTASPIEKFLIADAIREHNNRLHIFHDLRTLNERHFFGNACKVCVSTENTKLCARCEMVTYCSKEHQTLDWPIHKQICDLLAKVYNNIDRLLQFYKTRTLMHGRALVDRNLLKYLPAKIKDHIINESQALTEAFTESGKLPMLEGRYYSLLIMFPPICELCCGERINPNFWCKKCFTVGYCSLKHLQQNALSHSKFCSGLELFRKYNQQVLKIEKTLRQRFDVTARDIDLSKFESLTKFPENYDTFMKVIFGKNFKNCDALMNYQTDLNNNFKKAFPNENLDKKLVYYQIGDYFSPIGTFLHYMERIGFINNGVKKEKSAELNIFFLGIGWFDCSFLEVIDRVLIAYLKTPTSITPNLFFIGPCFKNWCYNRDPHVSFYSKITWVPFKLVDSIEALPHPDLIVMFDFKKERRTETFAADDLKEILNCPDVLKHNVPLLITSALRERIDDASKTARSEKAKVLVDPEENPYASKIPILLSGGGPKDSPLMILCLCTKRALSETPEIGNDGYEIIRSLIILKTIQTHNDNLEKCHDLSELKEDPFFGYVCKVCVSPANIKFCARCKTVTYCSKEHQTSDWPIHKKICVELAKVNANIDFLLQFSNQVKKGNIKGLVTQSMALANVNNLPAKEARYHEGLLCFPKICALCYCKRNNHNLYCQKCFAVGYCSLEHMQKQAYNHSSICSGLEVFRQYNNPFLKTEATKEKFRKAVRDCSWSNLRSLIKFPKNYDAFMNVTFGENFKSSKKLKIYQTDLENHFKTNANESLNNKLVYYQAGDYFAPVGTIIHYMERLGTIKNKRLSKKGPSNDLEPTELNFFFIGESWFCFNYLDVIDEVLNYFMESSLSPRFYFIGRCFKDWYYKRESVLPAYSKITWVPFKLVECFESLPKPDLVVMFNIKMEKQLPFVCIKDPLDEILNHPNMLPDVPILVTSASQNTLECALKVVWEENAKVLIAPEKNPFASMMPLQINGFDSDQRTTLKYANSFAMVVSTKNRVEARSNTLF